MAASETVTTLVFTDLYKGLAQINQLNTRGQILQFFAQL